MTTNMVLLHKVKKLKFNFSLILIFLILFIFKLEKTCKNKSFVCNNKVSALALGAWTAVCITKMLYDSRELTKLQEDQCQARLKKMNRLLKDLSMLNRGQPFYDEIFKFAKFLKKLPTSPPQVITSQPSPPLKIQVYNFIIISTIFKCLSQVHQLKLIQVI